MILGRANPNKPNELKVRGMREMRKKREEQTEGTYPPCYQRVESDFTRFSRNSSRSAGRCHRKPGFNTLKNQGLSGLATHSRRKEIQGVHSMIKPQSDQGGGRQPLAGMHGEPRRTCLPRCAGCMLRERLGKSSEMPNPNSCVAHPADSRHWQIAINCTRI